MDKAAWVDRLGRRLQGETAERVRQYTNEIDGNLISSELRQILEDAKDRQRIALEQAQTGVGAKYMETESRNDQDKRSNIQDSSRDNRKSVLDERNRELQQRWKLLKEENEQLEAQFVMISMKEQPRMIMTTHEKTDEGEFRAFKGVLPQKKDKTRLSVLEKEQKFLSLKVQQLQADLDQREATKQEIIKAINDLRSNRLRVEDVLETMNAERTCLLGEIEKLEAQKATSESIHQLKYIGADELSLEDNLDEYSKDNQQLIRQTEELRTHYDAKCSDLIEYFSGSISQYIKLIRLQEACLEIGETPDLDYGEVHLLEDQLTALKKQQRNFGNSMKNT
jgi:hypothetical protein